MFTLKRRFSTLSRMYLGSDRMISFMPNYWDSIYNGSNFLVIIAWCKSKRHIWLLFDLILEQMVCNWMFQTSMEQLMDIKIWYSLALLRHIIWLLHLHKVLQILSNLSKLQFLDFYIIFLSNGNIYKVLPIKLERRIYLLVMKIMLHILQSLH